MMLLFCVRGVVQDCDAGCCEVRLMWFGVNQIGGGGGCHSGVYFVMQRGGGSLGLLFLDIVVLCV